MQKRDPDKSGKNREKRGEKSRVIVAGIGGRSYQGIFPENLNEGVFGLTESTGITDFGNIIVRFLDIILAIVAILILLPMLLAVGLGVFVSDRGPILFAHSRIGRSGEAFPCFKFRSMVVDAEKRLATLLAQDPEQRALWERDHKLLNDPRVTRLGNFLRRSSIDELPQLLNVLRGEMSLVGPRPITNGEVFRYGRHFSSYCQVRPGITGLWQISGRSDVSYRRRVALDAIFVRKFSVLFYITIIWKTVPAVLFGKGSR